MPVMSLGELTQTDFRAEISQLRTAKAGEGRNCGIGVRERKDAVQANRCCGGPRGQRLARAAEEARKMRVRS